MPWRAAAATTAPSPLDGDEDDSSTTSTTVAVAASTMPSAATWTSRPIVTSRLNGSASATTTVPSSANDAGPRRSAMSSSVRTSPSATRWRSCARGQVLECADRQQRDREIDGQGHGSVTRLEWRRRRPAPRRVSPHERRASSRSVDWPRTTSAGITAANTCDDQTSRPTVGGRGRVGLGPRRASVSPRIGQRSEGVGAVDAIDAAVARISPTSWTTPSARRVRLLGRSTRLDDGRRVAGAGTRSTSRSTTNRSTTLRRRGRRLLAAIVGLEEAGALERDPDRGEDLLDGQDLAGVGMGDLGEVVVVEALLDFDGLAGVDELVDVGWHRAQKDIVRAMQVRSAVIPAAGLGNAIPPGDQGRPEGAVPDRRSAGDPDRDRRGARRGLSITSWWSAAGRSRRSTPTSPRRGAARRARCEGQDRAGRTVAGDRTRLARRASSTRTTRRASATPSDVPARPSATSRSRCCCPTS
jgi:hypothetical protein